jgi:alkylation response protein AidB-like acyl-CoA dehydrogenase
VAPKLAARAEEYDRDARFPAADVDDLQAEGLGALMVPTELGGLGAGFAQYVQVAMELGRASPATALLFNMHASVTGGLAGIPKELARALGASEDFFEERERILRHAVDGALYGVAISEAGVGSRLSRLQTRYRPEDDGFRITGAKVACSGAGHLDGYLVAALAAPVDGTERGVPLVSYFFLPGDAVTAEGEWDPLGMRATASRGLRLDAWVPRGALLGGVEGLAVMLAYTMPQWLVSSYAAVYVGLAEGVTEAARRFVTSGGRKGTAVRSRLGRADAAVAAARLAVERAAELVDTRPAEPETNRWIYRAKLLAGDAAMEVAASLAEACGLGALARGSSVERAFRDARFGAVMPPRSDVCADYLGAVILGLDPQSDLEDPPW